MVCVYAESLQHLHVKAKKEKLCEINGLYAAVQQLQVPKLLVYDLAELCTGPVNMRGVVDGGGDFICAASAQNTTTDSLIHSVSVSVDVELFLE